MRTLVGNKRMGSKQIYTRAMGKCIDARRVSKNDNHNRVFQQVFKFWVDSNAFGSIGLRFFGSLISANHSQNN